MNYYEKYMKYKSKYLNLKLNMHGGKPKVVIKYKSGGLVSRTINFYDNGMVSENSHNNKPNRFLKSGLIERMMEDIKDENLYYDDKINITSGCVVGENTVLSGWIHMDRISKGTDFMNDLLMNLDDNINDKYKN